MSRHWLDEKTKRPLCGYYGIVMARESSADSKLLREHREEIIWFSSGSLELVTCEDCKRLLADMEIKKIADVRD